MRAIDGKITRGMKDIVDENNIAKGEGYPIKTFRELVEITAALAYLNKDYLLFYRGQSTDHKSKSEKSSFYPSIYRGDYLPKREIEHRFDILSEASHKLIDALGKEKISGAPELRRKKYIQWSILQHYEVCGTPLLDFTQSLRVACSFAQQNNESSEAYIYVFGMPYITNRISINSEHDLVNVRLLSICPPEALRPYFQEGYLTATSDVDYEYDSKTELDFNRRLIAKFRIPNNKRFWGKDFSSIPQSALYPHNDKFEKICNEIKLDVKRELKPGQIGEFLSKWADLEEFVTSIGDVSKEHATFFNSLKSLRQSETLDPITYNNLDKLRRFRNQIVHKPRAVNIKEVESYLQLLDEVTHRLNKNR